MPCGRILFATVGGGGGRLLFTFVPFAILSLLILQLSHPRLVDSHPLSLQPAPRSLHAMFIIDWFRDVLSSLGESSFLSVCALRLPSCPQATTATGRETKGLDRTLQHPYPTLPPSSPTILLLTQYTKTLPAVLQRRLGIQPG